MKHRTELKLRLKELESIIDEGTTRELVSKAISVMNEAFILSAAERFSFDLQLNNASFVWGIGYKLSATVTKVEYL